MPLQVLRNLHVLLAAAKSKEEHMGWASGSSMFSDIIEFLMETVDDEEVRKDIYVGLIEIFENKDCDTLYECQGQDPAFDEVWEELYPSEEEDLWAPISGTAFDED